MRKIMLAGVCLLVLSGCAAQRAAETKAAFNAEVAQCKAQYPEKVGNYAARARCYVAGQAKYYSNDPMASVMAPLVVSLGTKIDRGEMSKEDADLQIGRTAFELKQELARTGAVVAAGQGAAMQGQAAMLNATKLPIPHTTNCYGFANSVTCTGN